MIELERHIEILLLDNDCVIVPELGGFVAHHREARYDERDNTFLPPLRAIGFNPKLQLNDSLLAQSYIEAYDISYPDAVERINDEVNELKQHIENEGSYELNNIGIIQLNEDGNYTFEPCEAGILTPSLYGLGSFEMDEIKPVATVVPMEVKPVEIKEEPVVADESQEEVQPAKTISIKVSALRNAVAIAAAIIAFFIFTTPIGDSPEVITRPQISKITMEQQVNKAEIAKTPEVKVAQPKVFWSIVMASKVTTKNAEAYVAFLKSKGFEASVLSRKSGNKVIYGTYKTENDAYKALRELRNHELKDFQEAWVYEVKR